MPSSRATSAPGLPESFNSRTASSLNSFVCRFPVAMEHLRGGYFPPFRCPPNPGYLKAGHLILKLNTAVVGSLHEGLAAALVGEKWGYIDRYGAFKIKPQFEMAKEFAEGLAPVKSGGKWGSIDRTRTFRVLARIWLADRFTHG